MGNQCKYHFFSSAGGGGGKGLNSSGLRGSTPSPTCSQGDSDSKLLYTRASQLYAITR